METGSFVVVDVVVVDVQALAYVAAIALMVLAIFLAYPLVAYPSRPLHQQLRRVALLLLTLYLLVGDIGLTFFSPLVKNNVLEAWQVPDEHIIQLCSLGGLALGVLGSLYGVWSLREPTPDGRPTLLAQVTVVLTLAVPIALLQVAVGFLDDNLRRCAQVYCAPVTIALAQHVGHATFFLLSGVFVGVLDGMALVLFEARISRLRSDTLESKDKVRSILYSRTFWFTLAGVLVFFLVWATDVFSVGPANAFSDPVKYTLFDAATGAGVVVLLFLGSRMTRYITGLEQDPDKGKRKLGMIGVGLILITFTTQAIGPLTTLLASP